MAISRRALAIGSVLSGLGYLLRSARIADAREMPPDSVVKAVMVPTIKSALEDDEYCKEMWKQLERVCGDDLAELLFKVTVMRDPRILWKVPRLTLMRQYMGLPKLLGSELKALRDKYPTSGD